MLSGVCSLELISHWPGCWVGLNPSLGPRPELGQTEGGCQGTGRPRVRGVGSAAGHALAVLLHQGDQALRRAALQQEGVLQQVCSAGPLQWVPGQHAFQEVLQHRGDLGGRVTN